MTTTTQTGAASTKLDAAVMKIAAVVVLGALMSILDITVVSIALPTFQDDFHTRYSTVAWTMTGYTLALATVIPLTGWAADRFGTKRLYIMALALFTLGSGLCALADGIGMLIAFRVLQGLGGGMLMPLGMTIMTHAAGPERVGRVMAVLGVPMLLGPIGGPILGGWLIQAASWHWIFLINLPIGVVALAVAVWLLPKDRPSPSESFDFIGMLLLSPGLALLLFGVSSIPETNTVGSARVLLPGIAGVLLIVAFAAHARRPEHPLVDLRLLNDRNMAIAVITFILFAVAFFGAMLLFPSYFLQIRGQSTLDTGLLQVPLGVGTMLSMPLAGWLTDKIGPGRIVLTGMVCICVGMAAFTQVGADTSYTVLLAAMFVMGVGMGAAMMPIMSAALQTLKQHQVARGSTLLNIVEQVGSAIGVAILSTILTNGIQGHRLAGPAILMQTDPEQAAAMQVNLPADQLHVGLSQGASSYALTFTVALVLVALCLIPAWLLPRGKPAMAEQPHPVAVG
jgi:EmrB/QacA subfamily drug resistance transporter